MVATQCQLSLVKNVTIKLRPEPSEVAMIRETWSDQAMLTLYTELDRSHACRCVCAQLCGRSASEDMPTDGDALPLTLGCGNHG